jgi:hypothetical protein
MSDPLRCVLGRRFNDVRQVSFSQDGSSSPLPYCYQYADWSPDVVPDRLVRRAGAVELE